MNEKRTHDNKKRLGNVSILKGISQWCSFSGKDEFLVLFCNNARSERHKHEEAKISTAWTHCRKQLVTTNSFSDGNGRAIVRSKEFI